MLLAKQTKSPLTLANGLFENAIPLKLRKVFTPHYEMAIFITYTMTNMKSTLTYINHMHLVRGKEQSLTPQRYYLFLNIQKKVRLFTILYEKKGGIGIITTSASLKITHTNYPK